MAVGGLGGLVPVFIAIAALAFGKKAKAKGKADCSPFEWKAEEVELLAQQLIDGGMRGEAEIVETILLTVYPLDPDGQPAPWPAAPTSAHRCIVDRIVIVVRVLIKDAPPVVEPPGPAIKPLPKEVLDDLLSDTPIPGHFFKVTKKIRAALGKKGITGRALDAAEPGAGSNSRNRLEYLHCMTGDPRWNLPLYGSSRTTDKYPAWAGVGGQTLWAAFMGRNKNAIKSILEARMPERNIDDAGNKLGSGPFFGLLWLPPIDEAALREFGTVACATDNWPDGSSTISPPPRFFEAIGVQ